MATGTYFPAVPQQYLDNSGNPLAGGTLETFIAGTVTHLATFSDVGLTVQNANPMTLDASGRPQAGYIFATPGLSYKAIWKDSTGATMTTPDNILAIPPSSATLDITGTFGETVTAGQGVYLSDGSGAKTAGQWFKWDSGSTYSSTTPQIGIVPAAVTTGSAGTIRLLGSMAGLSSLTPGSIYYVGASGALTSTAPANSRFVGQADTTTSLILSGDPPPVPIATQAANKVYAGPASGVAAVPTFRLLAGADLTSAGAVRVLDRKVVLTDVVSTTTETTVYSFSVVGGTLSTNKSLWLRFDGDFLNNSGGNTQLTVRVKYGATTILNAVHTALATSADRRGYRFDANLTAANATGAQYASGWNLFGNVGPTNTGTMVQSVTAQGFFATNVSIAEDSTAAKTFSVTFQHDTSAATVSARLYTAFLVLEE